MKILIDTYHRYDDIVNRDELEFPDNAIIAKIAWSKYSAPLKRLETKDSFKTYQHDEMCYDVYVYLPDMDIESDVFKGIESSFERIEYHVMKLCSGILIRFYSCEFVGFDGFVTLDELNNQIDFSDQYYICSIARLIQKPNYMTDEIRESIEIANKPEYKKYLNNEPIDDKFGTFDLEILKRLKQVVSYIKLIRLDDFGVLVKDVGVSMPYREEKTLDNINHYVLTIETLGMKIYSSDNTQIRYVGNRIKGEFNKRINEIVNI